MPNKKYIFVAIFVASGALSGGLYAHEKEEHMKTPLKPDCEHILQAPALASDPVQMALWLQCQKLSTDQFGHDQSKKDHDQMQMTHGHSQ